MSVYNNPFALVLGQLRSAPGREIRTTLSTNQIQN